MNDSTYLNNVSAEEMESLLDIALSPQTEEDENYFEEVDEAENA